MVRLFRAGIILLSCLLFVTVGVAYGFFVRMNSDWVTLRWPLPRLSIDQPLRQVEYEVRSALLASGWLGAVALLALAIVLLLVHVRARRRADARIRTLEREVQALRNLPIRSPTPLDSLADERRPPEDEHLAAGGTRRPSGSARIVSPAKAEARGSRSEV